MACALALVVASYVARFQTDFTLVIGTEESTQVQRVGTDGRDIAASGTLWVDDAGAVRRSEVRLDKDDTSALLRREYDRDEKLGMFVPRRMDEDYRYRDGDNARLVFVSSEAK